MSHLIPDTAIARYTAAPSPSKVAQAVSLQNNIRDVLGNDYDTFLQGSYKNDTGVADINDVDIVAVRKSLISVRFTGSTASYSVSWDEIFQDIEDALEDTYEYEGKTERGDKCITINTNFHADVVPAVKISFDGNDPIAIYSFREHSERKNYPRVHYENNVHKQARTSDNYKPTVRMFKKWARNWFAGTKIAPSFYIECLIYNVPDERFHNDRATSFFLVGDWILESISRSTIIWSVAHDKDILADNEWTQSNYESFRDELEEAITLVAYALKATSSQTAQQYWQEAFNE